MKRILEISPDPRCMDVIAEFDLAAFEILERESKFELCNEILERLCSRGLAPMSLAEELFNLENCNMIYVLHNVQAYVEACELMNEGLGNSTEKFAGLCNIDSVLSIDKSSMGKRSCFYYIPDGKYDTIENVAKIEVGFESFDRLPLYMSCARKIYSGHEWAARIHELGYTFARIYEYGWMLVANPEYSAVWPTAMMKRNNRTVEINTEGS